MKRAEVIHQGNAVCTVDYETVSENDKDFDGLVFRDKDDNVTAYFPTGYYGFHKISEVNFLGSGENTEGRV